MNGSLKSILQKCRLQSEYLLDNAQGRSKWFPPDQSFSNSALSQPSPSCFFIGLLNSALAKLRPRPTMPNSALFFPFLPQFSPVSPVFSEFSPRKTQLTAAAKRAATVSAGQKAAPKSTPKVSIATPLMNNRIAIQADNMVDELCSTHTWGNCGTELKRGTKAYFPRPS